MEKLFKLCSFAYLFTVSLAQIVSDVKQQQHGGILNDGQIPSQLALCILVVFILYIYNMFCTFCQINLADCCQNQRISYQIDVYQCAICPLTSNSININPRSKLRTSSSKRMLENYSLNSTKKISDSCTTAKTTKYDKDFQQRSIYLIIDMSN